MDGEKRGAGPVEQNGFGAVAVMHVEIENGDPLCAGGGSFEHGDGDVVQVTKAHRPVAGGVMTGRSHQTENAFALARGGQRGERGGSGGAGETGDVFVKRRVGVKIHRLVQVREMFRRMSAKDLCIAHLARFGPFDGQFGLVAQEFECGEDAQRAFGMAGMGIGGAAFVSDDFHVKI